MTDAEGLYGAAGSAGAPDYQTVLVPLDGSHLAEQVLPHTATIAQRFDSNIVLLLVTRSVEEVVAQMMPASTLGMRPAAVPAPAGIGGVGDPQPMIEAEQQEASEYLSKVAGNLEAQGLQVRYEVQQGPAADVILERARQLPAGLIAMTTHGQGGLGRLVFGSVADSVLRQADCPVLLVRINQEAEERENS